jgi:SecY interacting protein Syd
MTHTQAALNQLLERFLTKHKAAHDSLPYVEFNPPWPSLCTETTEDKNEDSTSNKLFWHPVKREQSELFISLEKGLEFDFPSELNSFYGSFWSNGICVNFEELKLQLIQIWNEEDEEHLKHNILGHCYARLKGKLPLSYFIGSSDCDEVLSLSHETGEVLLERPGKKAHRVLADSLPKFLALCEPNLEDYD